MKGLDTKTVDHLLRNHPEKVQGFRQSLTDLVRRGGEGVLNSYKRDIKRIDAEFDTKMKHATTIKAAARSQLEANEAKVKVAINAYTDLRVKNPAAAKAFKETINTSALVEVERIKENVNLGVLPEKASPPLFLLQEERSGNVNTVKAKEPPDIEEVNSINKMHSTYAIAKRMGLVEGSLNEMMGLQTNASGKITNLEEAKKAANDLKNAEALNNPETVKAIQDANKIKNATPGTMSNDDALSQIDATRTVRENAAGYMNGEMGARMGLSDARQDAITELNEAFEKAHPGWANAPKLLGDSLNWISSYIGGGSQGYSLLDPNATDAEIQEMYNVLKKEIDDKKLGDVTGDVQAKLHNAIRRYTPSTKVDPGRGTNIAAKPVNDRMGNLLGGRGLQRQTLSVRL